jgi:hypothetical protein
MLLLYGLNWSEAGHVINTNIDMNGYNLTEVGWIIGADGTIYTVNLTATGNISADWFLGNLHYSDVVGAPWITSYTETDPFWTANFSSTYNNDDWNEAYSWGDHASAGYLTSYTDTNVTTICTGDQVLLGNGSCVSSSEFDTTTYEIYIIITVSGGIGTGVSPLINHELLQLIVIPDTASNTYDFEAYETGTGTKVDRSRMNHEGTWNILKNTAISSSTVTFNITNATIDEDFNITMRYVR